MISTEELDIIRENERQSLIDAERIETRFMKLLDEYLKAQHLNLKTSSVPADGSCLYHAILKSFEAKYSYALESTHQNMRKRVAQYLLKNIDDLDLLEKFKTDEPSCADSSTTSLQYRYEIYCNRHMLLTTDWPIEVCLHAVTKIYGLQITIVAENLLENGKPAGYIFERLITTIKSDMTTRTEEINSIIIGNRWNQHYYSTIPIHKIPAEKTRKEHDIRKRKTEIERKRRANHKFLAATSSPEACEAFLTEENQDSNKRRREEITPERKQQISRVIINADNKRKNRAKKSKWLPIQQEWDELNPCR